MSYNEPRTLSPPVRDRAGGMQNARARVRLEERFEVTRFAFFDDKHFVNLLTQ